LILRVLELNLEIGYSSQLSSSFGNLHLNELCDADWAFAFVLKAAELLLSELDHLATRDLVDYALGEAQSEAVMGSIVKLCFILFVLHARLQSLCRLDHRVIDT